MLKPPLCRMHDGNFVLWRKYIGGNPPLKMEAGHVEAARGNLKVERGNVGEQRERVEVGSNTWHVHKLFLDAWRGVHHIAG